MTACKASLILLFCASLCRAVEDPPAELDDPTLTVPIRSAAPDPQGTPYRLATFSADVTMPLGHRCMGILPVKARHVVDPLEAHGLILLGAGEPIVYVAFDWCEIRNDAYDEAHRTIAAAVGASPQRVLISCLHQHDAPVFDLAAQKLLDDVGLEQELCDAQFFRQSVARVATAARDSLARASTVTHIGLGRAKVEQIASSRRVRTLDGQINFARGSASGGDAFLAAAPEGLVDPWLQTLSFWNDERQLAALSSYAVHPMSYYGRGGEVSADFVGAARRQRQKETDETLQIYATGCSGDTTAGKYNAGQPENRPRLAARLCQAMRDAEQSARKIPMTSVEFRSAKLALSFRDDERHTERALRAALTDSNLPLRDRILAAMGLSSRTRVARSEPIEVPCVDLGAAQLILLPAETFVGYQIMAQQMRPACQVMCLGYGECWPGYIPTQTAWDEGFSDTWLWTASNAAPKMRTALVDVLQPTVEADFASGEWGRLALSAERRARCFSVLREGLTSDEFWPSVHAAEALTRAGRGQEVAPVFASKLATETDAQKRCGLARELARSGERNRVAILLDALASADTHGHVHAAESLFKIVEVGTGRELRQAFRDSKDPVLRIMAGAALAQCGNLSALDYLRSELVGADADSRRLAAWVLGRLGDSSDIQDLRAQQQRAGSAADKAFFEHALAALGDREGLEALVRNLASDDPDIRAYAATFAGDARATVFAGRLLELLNDDRLDVRIRAAQSLLVLDAAPPRDQREDVRRMVFAASEDHPRFSEGSVVEQNDGALLFAVTQFDKSSSDFASAHIVGRVSVDEGRTWGPPRVLQDNTGSMNVMSATLRRLGRETSDERPLGLFYLQKNGYDDLDVYLRVSDDDGVSFGDAILVTNAPGYHVMNNDRVCRLSNGRLLAPVASTSDVQKENHFISYCYLSDDDGRTWRRGKGHVDQPKRGAMEPEVLELEDGKVLMIVRTQLGRIAASFSADGGDTWSDPHRLSVQAPEAPATLRRIPATGDLLLVWNNKSVEGADHGGERTPLTAAVSRDEGQSWQQMRDLESDSQRGYSYVSLAFVRDRTVLTYYEHDKQADRISTWFRSVPTSWFYESSSSAEIRSVQEPSR